jgi:hypothetical protein
MAPTIGASGLSGATSPRIRVLASSHADSSRGWGALCVVLSSSSNNTSQLSTIHLVSLYQTWYALFVAEYPIRTPFFDLAESLLRSSFGTCTYASEPKILM